MGKSKESIKKLLVIFVFILGFLLRFYKVSLIPPGITMDESSVGYNAYSIAKTGKDEYGKVFPIFFRAFTDYKMPGYIYLTVPWIKLFGLNVLSLRITSVLLGSISGLLIYFFVLELFGKNRWQLAFFSSLVYTFSPWSILFSRVASDGNTAFTILLLGIYLQFIAFKKNKPPWLILSALFYAAASYTYHTERVLSVLLFPLISFFLERKGLNQQINRKRIIFSFLVFILLCVPQYALLKTPAGNTRIVNTSVIKIKELGEIKNEPLKIFSFFKRQNSLYFAYFSPRNLFFDPSPMKERSLPELSTFYSWMVVPYLVGLYILFFKEDRKNKYFLVLSLAIMPIPASITGDPFATLRSLPLIFPLSIIIGLGLEKIFVFKKYFGLKIIILAALLLFSFLTLYRSLFRLLPYEKYLDWNFGYSQLVENLNKFSSVKVLFDDPIGDNYAEFLFFEKYSPSQFQKEQNQVNPAEYYSIADWKNTFVFDRYSIRPIFWEQDVYTKQLIVATPLAISESQAQEHFFTKAFAIIAPDGETVFNGYLTNPELKRLDNEKKLKKK